MIYNNTVIMHTATTSSAITQ